MTAAPPEGLRARKKREQRQRISDTATGMFIERGFDHVRVAEVAEACGVSEKTVYNYFPTKESLVLDRLDDMSDGLRAALGDRGRTVVQAVVDAVVADLTEIFAEFVGATAGWPGPDMLNGFMAMMDATPALRAAQWDGAQRMTELCAELLAERAGGADPSDPELQAAAAALVGLGQIQWRSWRRFLGRELTAAEARDGIIDDVRRAGRLLEQGLGSLA